ncbi:MAG: phosphatase PAP2 family protein [Gemmatales bacterium]|nr:MAG: phosphatase PAP2 family protein [Gemmatales bacterium]
MSAEQRRRLISFVGLALFFFCAFAIIGHNIDGKHFLSRLDQQLLKSLNHHRFFAPALGSFFAVITELGSRWIILAVTIVVAVVLVVRRAYWQAGIWFICVTAAMLANVMLKTYFSRPRPPQSGLDSWSFPSGHTTAAGVMFGLLAFLLAGKVSKLSLRLIAVAVLTALAFLVAFSRMYLGVHYFSDVVGSLIFSTGWILLWIPLFEWADRRNTSATKERSFTHWPEEYRSRARHRIF